MDIKGKVALVTGAKGAIGGGILQALEKEGVICIPVDKDIELGCDFTDPEAVEELAVKISEKYSHINYVFNVSGIGVYKKLEDLELADWLDTLSVNVTSPFLISKYLLPNLKKADGAMILNIGSGMGVTPSPDRSAYCMSKFALRGFSLSISKELKESGIDVCLLTLGSVMTPFGTGGLEKRRELEKEGKKYLSIEEVVAKIIEIVKSETREAEYVLYPEGYP